MDWIRKHLVDLSALCKDCEEDPALLMTQQRSFAVAYHLAKQFSSLPTGGGAKNVATVIAQLCGACQSSYSYGCAGRSSWQQPCPLVNAHIYQRLR